MDAIRNGKFSKVGAIRTLYGEPLYWFKEASENAIVVFNRESQIWDIWDIDETDFLLTFVRSEVGENVLVEELEELEKLPFEE